MRACGRLSAYSTSKFGLRGLTRSAALELGHDGIRVNAVLPGPIDTDMVAAVPRRVDPGRPARFPATAGPTRWRAWCCSSRPRSRRSSPVRSTSSTAARWPGSDRSCRSLLPDRWTSTTRCGAERSVFVELLRSLDDEDWSRPTECPAYDVQGVATHLLGDDLSLLSRRARRRRPGTPRRPAGRRRLPHRPRSLQRPLGHRRPLLQPCGAHRPAGAHRRVDRRLVPGGRSRVARGARRAVRGDRARRRTGRSPPASTSSAGSTTTRSGGRWADPISMTRRCCCRPSPGRCGAWPPTFRTSARHRERPSC